MTFVSLRLALLIGLALLLQACGSKVPTCSDPKTQALVLQMFHEGAAQVAAKINQPKELAEKVLAGIPITLTMIHASKHEEAIGKFTCEAKMEATLPQRAAQMASSPGLRIPYTYMFQEDVQVEGNVVAARIEFTSQLSDNKEQHLVTLRGDDGLAGMLIALGAYGAFSTPAATAPAPAPSTAALEAPLPAAVPASVPSATTETRATPSFDCSKATTAAERLICSSDTLARADADLALRYRQVLSTAGDPETVRKAQADWRRTQRDACADEPCMVDAYRQRLADLAR